MLTFPDLRPSDFEPWIDPAEAARKGRSAPEQAAATAAQWREGLARWGQDGERIRRLRATTDLALYTPGSRAGRQLSAIASLAPPSGDLPAEARAAHLTGTASALLALAGHGDVGPHDPAAVFLGALLQHFWTQGRAVDLGGLVRTILAPPLQRIGVLDLDTFFDAGARRNLAMRLNGVLASPGFAAWSEGEPLDIGRLLHGEGGRPRVSVLNIAHLGDAERMSFVTVPAALLSKTGMKKARTSLKKHVYQHEALELGRSADPKLVAEPGERLADFEVRVRMALREARDREVGEVRERYTAKLAKLQERMRRAEAEVATQQAQVGERKLDAALSVGSTVLGALFGKRTTLSGHASRAATAARRAKKVQKEHADVVRAQAELAELQREVRALDGELRAELAERERLPEPALTTLTVRPRKGDLNVSRLTLAWMAPR